MTVGKANVIALVKRPVAIVPQPVAQNPRRLRRGKGFRLGKAQIAHPAAFGHQHHAVWRDRDIGDSAGHFVAGAKGGSEKLAAGVANRKAAILVETNRPHRGALVFAGAGPFGVAKAFTAPDAVKNACLAGLWVGANRNPPHPAAEVSKVPASRRGRKISRRAARIRAADHLGLAGRIKGNAGQNALSAGGGVIEARPTINPVVILAQIIAGHCRDAVDHAGFKIGHQQLPVGGVIGDVAQRRAGIGPPVQGYLGERLGDVAIGAIKLIDRARPGTGAPLTRQPVGIIIKAMQPERRSRSHINIGRLRIVNRHPKDLPNLSRRQRQALGLIAPMAAIGYKSGSAHIDNTAHHPVLIQRVIFGAIIEGKFNSAGKTRRIGFTGLQCLLGAGWRCQRRISQQRKHRWHGPREPWKTQTRSAVIFLGDLAHNFLPEWGSGCRG